MAIWLISCVYAMSRRRMNDFRAMSSSSDDSECRARARQSSSVTPRQATLNAFLQSFVDRYEYMLADWNTSMVTMAEYCRQKTFDPLKPTTNPCRRWRWTGKFAVLMLSCEFPEKQNMSSICVFQATLFAFWSSNTTRFVSRL